MRSKQLTEPVVQAEELYETLKYEHDEFLKSGCFASYKELILRESQKKSIDSTSAESPDRNKNGEDKVSRSENSIETDENNNTVGKRYESGNKFSFNHTASSNMKSSPTKRNKTRKNKLPKQVAMSPIGF